ncbi:MAG: hypothetical protein UX91_C0006G0134 [Candidatus Amesbacteria bacterium GW2011_GWB1_47_19]|nr:MAG: hypothetical protein UW51_C0002G0135 [Candidatus Amesbacteria bacterium GW2011_GWA1_44_24]KKU31275.1 MAG: hypothetical protein UX46_C0006G0067 [Candidatus Amesbacteria bacterium GW2011_GWC1_46_24]KKU67072.1 MAG: hypothetical protein UX91_C0006G0134 [Candidatus Amesbacteria bacterium GW2011_GWB1_47_19]OGD04937.1 MAG: hypothetical protein A2379_04125 [Candidatus Amesbacteria bacterium RIFOXYB1_FULL_47_13]HBC72941.1 hypothetical protein [Candidatus Amesbacteria bacterium]
MKKNKLKGYIYLIISTIIYGLFGIFSRNTSDFGAFSQGAVRYVILCTFLLSLFLLKKVTWKKIERKDVKWFLTWILPASFQPVLTFVAFTHLPVGITYFLLYSTMILGGILSGKIFFHENFNFGKLISLVLVLIGLYLIYRSDITLITSVYVFVALLSGLIVGFWNTLTKKVSGNYPELQMILLDGSSTLSVSLLGLIVVHEVLPPISNVSTWLWIIGFAFSGILSSLFLIKGFKEVEAQVGSLILPMELIFASIFGFVFLGEILKVNVYLGGLLILFAAIVPAYQESYGKTN